jgi:hypothetical protein
MQIFSLNKIEKLKLIGQCVRAATGIVGGSFVIAEGHPYAAITVLALGGVSNEVILFISQKENEFTIDKLRNKE